MQCPNCSSQIPNTAKKCGVCGVPINTPPVPEKSGLPDWAKGLLIGAGIGLVIFVVLGAGYYFFYLKPSQSVSQTMPTTTMTIEPVQALPTATSVLSEAPPQQTQTPIPTQTTAPTQLPTPTTEPQYCDAFKGINMTVVYMDWLKGKPLEFYIKMPGGVPGLEKTIPGASEEWTYRAKIGDYSSAQCDIIAGYKERLYCEISLPSTYESAVHPMSLYANRCNEDVFSGENAFLPKIK